MATTKQSKVQYLPEIITIEETYEKEINISSIPEFKVENCEVMFSTLGSKTPKFGHNISLLLPSQDFFTRDRALRNAYLTAYQAKNPNMEIIKTSVKSITQKDILDNKFDESKLNKTYLDIRISNAYMFDRTIDEEGKVKDTRIAQEKEATGQAVVKYFRTIDKYTGKGIDPVVFRYNANGEKETTFFSKKTNSETPLYLGAGDLVNITVRPYESVNSNTGEVTLKYNLLSVEIVQTAWERGGGKTSGSKKNVLAEPQSVGLSELANIFGNFNTATPITQTTPEVKPEPKPVVQTVVQEPTPVAQVEQPAVTSVATVQPTEAVQQEVQPEQTTNTMPQIDFNQLASLDFGSLNLG